MTVAWERVSGRGAREFSDGSLRTQEDVVQGLALPVLALVPTVLTTTDRARGRRAPTPSC